MAITSSPAVRRVASPAAPHIAFGAERELDRWSTDAQRTSRTLLAGLTDFSRQVSAAIRLGAAIEQAAPRRRAQLARTWLDPR